MESDHDMIVAIHTMLLGVDGKLGLCAEFESHKDNDRKFREDYYKFKRWMIGVLCFMAGSGVLGLSVVGIIKGL